MPAESAGLLSIKPGAAGAFCLKFAAAFILLSLVGPWIRPAYENVFCYFAAPALRMPSRTWEVEFERASDSVPPNRLRAIIVNSTLMKPDGSGPVRNVDIDIEAFAWRPLALLTALSFAAPFPRRRRFAAWVFAVLGLQAAGLLILGLVLWSESADIGFHPGGLIETMTRGVGLQLLSLGLPVLVWATSVVSFSAKMFAQQKV